jgi:hypothetical protein
MGHRIEGWQMAHNTFRNGAYADLLALIPFIVPSVLLYLVGRDILFKTQPDAERLSTSRSVSVWRLWNCDGGAF